jgi:hypothetical protein
VVKDGPSESGFESGTWCRWCVLGVHVLLLCCKLILAIPITLTEASGAVQRAEIIMAIKERIDLYFDSMPVLMEALDEIAKLGGALEPQPPPGAVFPR